MKQAFRHSVYLFVYIIAALALDAAIFGTAIN
jgi:hypothetical protein